MVCGFPEVGGGSTEKPVRLIVDTGYRVAWAVMGGTTADLAPALGTGY
ncbi:MAG: hypothetical protein NZ473_04715 [Candidatus Kapabacteria bacterium]|nr:hypothetical protein [Candidatus Kapabacteria bacterium]